MKCGSNCMYWNIGYYIHQSEIQLVSYDTNSMRIHKIYQGSDMGDDLDVDAMLEAPFTKEDGVVSGDGEERGKENGHISHRDRSSKDVDRDRKEKKDKSREKDKYRSKDKERDRSREREREREKERARERELKERERERAREKERLRERERRRRSHSRRRSRSRSRERRHRTRSKSKERRRRSRERERRRTRSPSREKRRLSRSHSRERKRKRDTRSRSKEKRRSKTKSPKRELTAEERDARTVFCMQLSSRIRGRDLEDFFSVVGKISDVRIITDAKTRRSKGIAYVEFEDVESVPLALGLSGQKILGVPIIVQPTLAEKNRLANPEVTNAKGMSGPMRLYVGSLHFNITEDMLRSIFEPFGKIDHIQLITDTETGRSKGYGFITFHNSEDAKKALEQLNGFELAGRPMKVNHVTERSEITQSTSVLDSDEMERAGIDLGATGRLQLMAKLAEGTGLQLPQAAANALNMPAQVQQQTAPPIATQCFLLSNMFDPSSENNPNWATEISDDVIEECNKHGGVLHVFVDRQSAQGNVYVKCPTIATAVAAVNSLHGRFFAGKMITAAYVPVMSYHSLFPDAMTATKLLELGSTSN
ncbi:UNVERIFIED_CONTAM: hypothetical protein RMT77_012171 [Armadillidium vulgare]